MSFAVGDLKNRYRNSVLGFLWSILEPLILLSILYVIFSSILKTDIPNFPIYLLLGLVMWNFVVKSTMMGMDSISNRQSILSSIYFQRAIPPFASNITALIMLGLEFIIFSIFLLSFGLMYSPLSLLLPFFVFLIFLITLGISLALSVMSVFYNDVKFIWGLAVTAGFFIHPIIYDINMLSPEIKELFLLLPTVRLFDMIHQVVLYNVMPSTFDFIYVGVMSFVILFLGYFIYRIFEKRLGEVL